MRGHTRARKANQFAHCQDGSDHLHCLSISHHRPKCNVGQRHARSEPRPVSRGTDLATITATKNRKEEVDGRGEGWVGGEGWGVRDHPNVEKNLPEYSHTTGTYWKHL